MVRVIRAGETQRAAADPPEERKPKHFYYHYAQISAKVTYTDQVKQLGVKILRHCPVCNRLFGYEVKLIKYTPINTNKNKL